MSEWGMVSTAVGSDAWDAYQAGLSVGWDAANYAEAYGGNPSKDEPDVPSWYDSHFYLNGYHRGIHRYQTGRWADGSARD